jgi:hypothetical protein
MMQMETLSAEKPFYDALRAGTESQKLKSISFYPWHKGLDIDISGKIDQDEKDELESLAEEWFYTTDLMYSCEVSPRLNGDRLELDVSYSHDLTEDGAEWSGDNFFQTIGPLIAQQLNKEVDECDTFISFELEASDIQSPEISSLTITHDSEDANLGLELTISEELKAAIISYADQWAVANLQECSDSIHYSYSLNIENYETVGSFVESWNEKYLLVLI